MEGIERKGAIPWGDNPDYKVFRHVVNDYGADPTGQRDSTAAIQRAINDGKRCGAACNGATTKNAIVYFPPGTYLVSSSISIYFGTQIIGDAINLPTIRAASSFVGLGVLSTQIRNLKIDITASNPGAYVAALHYQVAQVMTIENVEIIADSAMTQQGMYAENGSGGVMSDITFTGGNFGIYRGSQQFSAARLTFNGCNTAVKVIWDWGWVWKSITVKNTKVGFRLYNDANGQISGSVTIINSVFSSTESFTIEMAVPVNVMDSGFTGLVLDNVTIFADSTNKPSLLGPSIAGLDVAPYFEHPRNQYTNKTAVDFIHLKDEGAASDGSIDNTDAVQNAFNKYGNGSKIILVDTSTYIIKRTITVPKNAKIISETWSQFAASGGYFSNASKPAVMLRVGNKGEVSNIELQDLILTSKGPTPGVILMEWNVAAESAGSAALWDVHIRLGGATGTKLTLTECPPITTGTNPSSCQLWVADHMIDDPLLNDPLNNMEQLSMYSAQGMLIESQKATWLYRTASEHSVFYQYNFNGAQNIFTTFLQTESPYYQPTPKPPAPFDQVVGTFDSDPTYGSDGSDADGCDASCAVIMKNLRMLKAL
ncbi:hypothetical protein Asppvi_011306 [Aspergillus pseudoviridinutans]|uniref:Rhamnogalacturonase A/B/Epimerase-like pectate lyase domain-containing protein n=1 Tax=Aspergillus pseudoviridinutans TaxID=1517512 RepID=A0A9P3BN24_9EURO|nr:uncharacterized protein Asppvi_011306 [Aspergillus pseudoviridinutans]GIJ92325.1 hypothetical protein Asppvi_011306 [Aspergillus pseudoviridinutans]